MVADWWEHRKKKGRRLPWFDVFEEFDQLEEMLNEMMRRTLKLEPSKITRESKTYGPYIYGFSFSLGPDGKPVIREFGNVQPSRFGPRLREEREPLVDIMEQDKEIVVVAELPGVEKNDLHLGATENTLTISVDTKKRKYFKELQLPADVEPKTAKATYKNGVLEVRLAKKKSEEKFKGEKISVE